MWYSSKYLITQVTRSDDIGDPIATPKVYTDNCDLIGNISLDQSHPMWILFCDILDFTPLIPISFHSMIYWDILCITIFLRNALFFDDNAYNWKAVTCQNLSKIHISMTKKFFNNKIYASKIFTYNRCILLVLKFYLKMF